MNEFLTSDTRHDFVYFLKVVNGNPNGDPANGNRPRTNPLTNKGIITAESMKRKIRDSVRMRYGVENYFDKDVLLSERHSVNTIKVKDVNAVTKYMLEKYWDVRCFGAILSTIAANPGNALRGALQMSMLESIDPVFPFEHTITRCTSINEKEKANQNIGQFHNIPFGVYKGVGSYSPCQRELSVDDIEKFYTGLYFGNQDCESTARPPGSVEVAGLWIYVHDSKYGNALLGDIHEMVKYRRTSDEIPQSMADYELVVAEDIHLHRWND